MLVVYAAVFDDATEARQAVETLNETLEGDKVGDAAPLSDATVHALGLKPSDVRML